jgi:ADP-ribosyl-[dinitrogen reductase] hydrolase
MKTDDTILMKERILGGLWGSLVGDALGVPVEFKDRATVQANPVTDMREYGTHHQPRGTWSDDGALLLCTVDSLLNHEFNLDDMGSRFVRWLHDGLWTAHGNVFDVGGATSAALSRIETGTPADMAGGKSEGSNGNGSLMRILPAVLRFAAEPIESFADHISKVSAITHGHARSQMACVFYGLAVQHLMHGQKPQPAMDSIRAEFTGLYKRSAEFARFRPLLEDDFHSLPEPMIVSTGYVLHTLHASLWCLLTTQNFRECVLKAVNLGGDSDTTGCVTGGLAGVMYGADQIPPEWIGAVPRRHDLDCLFGKFVELCAAQAK